MLQGVKQDQETPSPEDVLACLVQELKDQAHVGKIRAAGVCYNGRIDRTGKKEDAIIAGFEHINHNACKIYVPYRKSASGRYQLAEMFAQSAEPQIFPAT